MNIEVKSESIYYDLFCQVPFLNDSYNVSSGAFVAPRVKIIFGSTFG